MTREEFSNGFDVLVNSYRRGKSFDDQELLDSIEFNEYEKSLFLTKAQEEIVVSLYNGRNMSGESFEKTEELRRYLSNLVKDTTLQPLRTATATSISGNSKFFQLPTDLWFITYESVKVDDARCDDASIMDVYPVTQDEYHKVKRNPFRGANDRRALRLDVSGSQVEIVCKYNVVSYYIRYIKELLPIILVNLPNDLTIKGEGYAQDCELHEALHERILERAVQLGLQSKGYTSKNRE